MSELTREERLALIHNETFRAEAIEALLDENARLKAANKALAERVAAQSELLSRRAEK